MPKLIERIDKRGKNVKRNFSVTLPIELIRIMNWEKGDDLYISKLSDETLKIEKVGRSSDRR